jgi:hypothetical protein
VAKTIVDVGELSPHWPAPARRQRASAWRFEGWKAPNKDRHQQAGALLLDSDYFVDNATHALKDFWCRFMMNKDLFMKIVFGARGLAGTNLVCRFPPNA